MSIDFSGLERAAGQLERSLAYCDSDLARSEPELAVQFRSATIQAFKYTYELGHKTIRRALVEMGASAAAIDRSSFAIPAFRDEMRFLLTVLRERAG